MCKYEYVMARCCLKNQVPMPRMRSRREARVGGRSQVQGKINEKRGMGSSVRNVTVEEA